MRAKANAVCVLTALAFTLACSRARESSPRAYPRLTPSGAPLRWRQPTIVLQPVRPGSERVSEALLLQSLREEIEIWNRELSDCHAPRLALAQIRKEAPQIKQDGVSAVLIRTSDWCPDGATNDATCYDHDVEALTRVYPNEYGSPDERGVIAEADIEINAVYMRWSLDGSVSGTHSLRATLAHELGHVLGLDDACNTPDALLAKGNHASLAPLCTAQDVRTSIMYPDPNVSGRPLVLKPGPNEVDLLCRSYAVSPLPH